MKGPSPAPLPALKYNQLKKYIETCKDEIPIEDKIDDKSGMSVEDKID